MTPRQTVAVGVRLFAVWLLLDALDMGYFALVELGKAASTSTLVLGFVLTIVWVLAGAVLWIFAGAIAHKLLPRENNNAGSDPSGIAPATWLAVGCALIGVWVIVSSLPPLAQDMANAWPSVTLGDSGIYFIVRIVLGVWLILGARGLRIVMRWTQYAGIQRSEESGVGQR